MLEHIGRSLGLFAENPLDQVVRSRAASVQPRKRLGKPVLQSLKSPTFSVAGMSALVAMVVFFAGCRPPDQITNYEAPKEHEPSNAAAQRERQRTLAAIIPVGDQAWFFKITGLDELVEKQAQPFRSLLDSVRFQAEKVAGEGVVQPVWELPDGWRSVAGDGGEAAALMRRFATVEIPVDGQTLELTVTPLPRPVGADEAYMLANVNRWRRQLQLPPLAADELAKNCETFEVDGKSVSLVNIQGPAPANSERPPIGASRPAGPVAQGAAFRGSQRLDQGARRRVQSRGVRGWDRRSAGAHHRQSGWWAHSRQREPLARPTRVRPLDAKTA